ncbi:MULTISPECIES: aldose epimerase family protein [Rhodomicrobium]|uniref:aldose epimerase family protein n=1 Tax=Rhodomicrobium sp. R_RK_3 TaxID=2029567 RepID=UPI001FDA4B62|nr:MULTISPECIES: aldose epimerase family protein [Rhodomicrobium]
MDAEIFGYLPDGQPVHRVAIQGGGLSATIINWGAVVQDLRLAGHADPLVLGFDNFADYPAHSPYFGAVVGRFANRIADGRFSIDGIAYQADRNFLGKHALHGGASGIGRQLWTLADAGADFVTMTCRARDGEMGFPGNLDVTCTYALKDAGRLVVELTATTDAPTVCNLAHHSYFNLDDGGRTDVLNHIMQIEAEAYLPVDGELIPTGEVIPVAGTEYDFRAPRPVRRGEPHRPYDHNFCLAPVRGALQRAVTVEGARSGIAMEVWTTEPGVQFYDGPGIAAGLTGLDGVGYAPHSALCLEPQIWPDAPHRPYFPQALLRPGERYAQTTEYRFRKAGR